MTTEAIKCNTNTSVELLHKLFKLKLGVTIVTNNFIEMVDINGMESQNKGPSHNIRKIEVMVIT